MLLLKIALLFIAAFAGHFLLFVAPLTAAAAIKRSFSPERVKREGMRTRKTKQGVGVLMPECQRAITYGGFWSKALAAWRMFWAGAALHTRHSFGGAYYDLAAGTAIMKELYDGQIVENEVYQDNPAFTMIPKMTGFYGKNRPVPLVYGVSTGSANFQNAQANQAPVQNAEFLMTRKREYALATLDNETMEATANDKGAFIDALSQVVDGAIQKCTLRIASGMFRAGTGSIGQVSTTVAISTGLITLADPTSVTQFEINDVLQANATDGGASPRAALGYVVARSAQAGTITVATSGFGGAAATPGSWTTSDFLLVQGDLNAKMSGFPAWLNNPANITSTDNFYGVNRSIDPWRLGGGYYDGSAYNIEEGLTNAANLLAREGSGVNICFTNFQSYQNLENALGAKCTYDRLTAASGDAEIAFEGIKLIGPRSRITVLPDRNCPQKTAYLLKMSNWKLGSLGEAPRILTYKDTNQMLRVTNADAMEARVGAYLNVWTNAPGFSAQVLLGA